MSSIVLSSSRILKDDKKFLYMSKMTGGDLAGEIFQISNRCTKFRKRFLNGTNVQIKLL